MTESNVPAARDRPSDVRPLHLVVGASGYIGSNLVPELLRAGRRVRATARSIEVLEGRGWSGAELVQADVLDPATAARSARGCRRRLLPRALDGRRQRSSPRIDRRAAEHFAQAAAAAGVRRIVYLGGLIPPNPRSQHLLSRAETGEVLRRGPVPGDRAARRHDHRARLGGLRSDPRSRQSPADDGHAVLGAFALDADRLARPARLPARRRGAAGGRRTHPRRGRSRRRDLRGDHALLRGAGRPAAAASSPCRSSPRGCRLYWLRFVTSVPTNVARALVEGLQDDSWPTMPSCAPWCRVAYMSLEEAIRGGDRGRPRPHRHRALGGRRDRLPQFPPRVRVSTPSARAAPLTARAAADDVFRVVCTIGEGGDYFYANALWWLRRAANWVAGSPSFRRTRRHPAELRVGDVVDSWRVIALEPGRRLTLLMEMKAPGAGVQELVVQAVPRRQGLERDGPRRTGTRPAWPVSSTGTRWCPRTCSSSAA